MHQLETDTALSLFVPVKHSHSILGQLTTKKVAADEKTNARALL